MWYQGEEQMPLLVKAAYRSIKAHAGEHPVILLTKDNIRQIVSKSDIWDNDIFDYLNQGKITMTHFSDLCRTALLYSFGGIWIDATIFMQWDVDRIAEGVPLATGRRERAKDSFNVCFNKWTSFFIGCEKGNPLLGFIYELLHEHLKREGRFMEYLIEDYAFMTAYNHLPYVREMADNVPLMPNRLKELEVKRNKEYEATYYEEVCKNVPFTKMTYKHKCKTKTRSGKMTNYGHMLACWMTTASRNHHQ